MCIHGEDYIAYFKSKLYICMLCTLSQLQEKILESIIHQGSHQEFWTKDQYAKIIMPISFFGKNNTLPGRLYGTTSTVYNSTSITCDQYINSTVTSVLHNTFMIPRNTSCSLKRGRPACGPRQLTLSSISGLSA